ncbi:ABC transporter permease [Tessaracoccus sp. ZS01]|uniref:ABC transporter permease n=1 Tax=Tessaracoccus sp. ZS01 TaxID=1906324 RepID=UPI00117EC2BE|nr:ABC transporter permease [Tessaracoccus sp. ZS01]MCG6566590.1 ABC transporter permease [Tessaracoccus sp. ZS01]
MEIAIGWPLAIGLVLLVALGAGVALWGRVSVWRTIPWVALRAAVQLLLVSFLVGFALSHWALAFAFVFVMFIVGVLTTAQRTDIKGLRGHLAVAVAMAAGAVPVLTIIFATGTAPLTGPSIVPIAGIMVGNMMTAHTLAGRRNFAELRNRHDEYEAWLALGVERGRAIRNVVSPTLHEALIPSLDQTRTVGLVTLPGAYIGVLLGGGSAWDAAAAQLLVLVGINAGQVCTAVAARWLSTRTWLLPPDLAVKLHA